MKELRVTIAGAPGSGRTSLANYMADILKMNGFDVNVIDYPGEGDRQVRLPALQIIENARKIGKIGADGARVTIIANQTARFGAGGSALQSVEFEVGNTYKSFGGQMVKMVERRDEPGYEVILGKDDIWRYNRDADRGRVTGTAHDFSCAENLIPLYSHPIPGLIESMRIDLSMALREVEELKKKLARAGAAV